MLIEALDDSELKPKRTYTEAYKSIPEDVYSKRWAPLSPTVLYNLQFYDWSDYRVLAAERMDENEARLFDERMKNSLSLNEALDLGKIKRKAETMVYWGYPPNLTIRADLHSSSSVMIYGPSHDISFLGVNDITREIRFGFTLHMEDGYPTDYWIMLPDDEALEKRHMKLGYKLKEMPQKFDDLALAASRVRDIMMDIRNERNPQWAASSYQVALFFIMIGGITKFSNWDAIGQIYDGVNARNMYQLPHSLFLYEPWPPMLNTFFALKRDQWCVSLSRMLSMNQLYMQHVDKDVLEHGKKHYYDEYLRQLLNYSYQLKVLGVPLPKQTLECELPKYDPNIGEWQSIDFKYPKGPLIFYEDLGLTFDEAISGVLFNITHKSKVEKVTHDDIISIGHGFDTKYLKPEGWIEEQKKKKRLRRKVKKIKKIIKYKKSS